MRIGIDARMYKQQGTGISRYIKELVDHVVALDQENEYIIFLSPDMYESYQCPSHVTKICADAPYYSLKEQVYFWQILYKAKLDIMHFTHFNSPLLYFGKSVVTIHDVTLSKFPGQKMNTFLHRMAYKLIIWAAMWKASKIITVSNHTQKDIHELFGIPYEKCVTTYLGVDSFSKTPLAQQKEISNRMGINKSFILYVGVWRNHKNMLYLIETFDMLKQKGHDIQLVMTGKESPYYPEIRHRIEKSVYKNDIITPGFVSDEDLRALYSSTILLVNPSFYEGFGIPPLEAMASGAVVAVSEVTSHPEVCGDAALYFDPYSVADMVTVLEKAIGDKALREDVQKKGKEHVQQFRWDSMAKKTLSIYKNI